MPCQPHKEKGVHCDGCSSYAPTTNRILIIKLGAAGDVIRTTPLLRRLRAEFPDAHITWLSDYPELVPASHVDKILDFKSFDVFYLLGAEFDLLYSLDKDYSAVSLASLVKAKVKKGFVLKDNKPNPADKDAEHKYLTGLFDDVSRENKKHYVQEIFEICGFEFKDEKYVFELPADKPALPKLKGPVIGLNTGCGSRWTTRLWSEEKWGELVKLIMGRGYTVLLLGGPQEDELNKRLAKQSGAKYLGTFPLQQFLHVVDLCDLIVTQVTMALHIALGLGTKVVLLNNIFNRHEFYLYGLGDILEPPKDCLGCYKGRCDENCMDLILPARIDESVKSQL
jgi:heptosyltransferase-2